MDDQYVGEVDDLDLDEVNNKVLNPGPPSFPLQLENEGEELRFLNPKSCSFCGKFFNLQTNLRSAFASLAIMHLNARSIW